MSHHFWSSTFFVFDFLNQLLLLQTVFCMMTLKFHDTYEVRDDADSISIISLFAIANILVVHRRDTKHSGLILKIPFPIHKIQRISMWTYKIWIRIWMLLAKLLVKIAFSLFDQFVHNHQNSSEFDDASNAIAFHWERHQSAQLNFIAMEGFFIWWKF